MRLLFSRKPHTRYPDTELLPPIYDDSNASTEGNVVVTQSLSRKASLRYDVVYDEKVSRTRAVIIAEPPTRRILAWSYEGKADEIDMPIPWVYTYLKVVKVKEARDIWHLWDTRVFFSAVEVKDPTTQPLSSAFVSNLSARGEVCWGARGFSYEMPTRVDQFVPLCLNNFWFRRFNAEIPPHGDYYEAFTSRYGTARNYLAVMRKIGKHSVDEITALDVKPTKILAQLAWIPTEQKDRRVERSLARAPEYNRYALEQAAYRPALEEIRRRR